MDKKKIYKFLSILTLLIILFHLFTPILNMSYAITNEIDIAQNIDNSIENEVADSDSNSVNNTEESINDIELLDNAVENNEIEETELENEIVMNNDIPIVRFFFRNRNSCS